MKVSNIIAGIVTILVLIIVGTVFTQTQTPVEEPVNPITVVDYEGRIVSLEKPAERVVALVPSVLRIITQIDGSETVVGIDNKAMMAEPPILPILAHPEYLSLPNVGERKEPNVEAILSLDPDAVFTTQSADNADTLQEQLGVPVICVVSLPEADYEYFRLVGKVINREQEAEEVIQYIQDQTERITSITETIPETEKPKIYLGLWTNEKVITKTMPSYQGIQPAGGINVAAEVAPTTFWGMAEIKKEQIIAWNPDIILIHWLSEPGYMSIQDVYDDSDMVNVEAVNKERVYYSQTSNEGKDYASTLAELYYFAKIFHPDRFQDIELNEECDAFFYRLYGLEDYYTDWTKEYGITP